MDCTLVIIRVKFILNYSLLDGNNQTGEDSTVYRCIEQYHVKASVFAATWQSQTQLCTEFNMHSKVVL
jgi:hypothetical protein